MFDANDEPSIEVRKQLIECLKGECKNTTTDSRPLNIVVIGSPGSGKSSFINTAIASLRGDKWRSYVKSGDYGKVHSQITNRFHSVSAKSDYYIHKPETLLPTFIDINGLENNNGPFNRIFLEALFAGKIQEDEKISELKVLFDENEDMFRTNLFKRSTYLEIDRIVAVASGDSDVTLPSQLYSCIKKIAQHDNVIPIFAVVTKCDKELKDESPKKKMKELAQHLGITRDNIKRVKNYCPEIDEEMRYHHVTFPHIDIPILELLIQIASTKVKVISEHVNFYSIALNHLRKAANELGYDTKNMPKNEIGIKSVQVVFVCILIIWVSQPTLSFEKLNLACLEYNMVCTKRGLECIDMKSICDHKLELTTFPTYWFTFFLIFICVIIPYVGREINMMECIRFLKEGLDRINRR